ncbi:MAG: hypothetical protein FOGNACKC_02036 [Anaerolineae bacterium]|nr:hypothetical protein [Anaerolineae bacterium]
MDNEIIPNPSTQGCASSGCLLWFLGGITLSFTIVLSMVLLVLLIGSLALNAYLGWQLSNLQITVSQKPPEMPAIIVVTATPEIAAQPTIATEPSPEPTLLPPPTTTATPVPPNAQVQAQIATVSAIATGGAEEAAAFVPPTNTPAAAVPLDPAKQGAPAAQAAPPPANTPTAADTPPHLPPAGDQVEVAAPYISNNTFEIIPIEGERESRPAAEHGDLNLKLRTPEKIAADAKLVEISGAGSDPNTPKFSKVFEPNIIAAYGIHGWDWAKNDKSDLVNDGKAILVQLKTTPGKPIYIPPTDTDIFGGNIYATVLYADEDSITYVYARRGNVVKGYTMHLIGLETDPNLVKAFRESEGNNLPGLTLTTPIGRATDKLLVAIRDNGTFMDARSLKDWWD